MRKFKEDKQKSVDLSKSNHPKDFLETALKIQGLDKAPAKMKEKWSEGEVGNYIFKFIAEGYSSEKYYFLGAKKISCLLLDKQTDILK